jgi:hypothetical protein
VGVLETAPISRRIVGLLRNSVNKRRKAWKQTERVFDKIYRRNDWRSNQSASGTGSEDSQTEQLVRCLPRILHDLGVTRILDIPCGDFNWMRHVDLGGIDYTGADILAPLIAENRKRYGGEGRSFRQLNLVMDVLPKADFILCRDCLVHLSLADIAAALRNIAVSEATYLATTTFPGRKANIDIKTGGWRPLNLLAAPFHFPQPLKIIEEGCTEAGGAYADKSLAIWRVGELPAIVE